MSERSPRIGGCFSRRLKMGRLHLSAKLKNGKRERAIRLSVVVTSDDHRRRVVGAPTGAGHDFILTREAAAFNICVRAGRRDRRQNDFSRWNTASVARHLVENGRRARPVHRRRRWRI